MKGKITIKLINNFLDYNYENIAFDIRGVDKADSKQKLLKDHVNHLYELDDARYIAIWNCDLQGFRRKREIYFDGYEPAYTLAKLTKRDGELLYDIIDNQARVSEDYQLM